ncbi:MAG: efflux transporter outer membrane subunit [Candidatus Glassbacteria bacterium]|nr:efflux transporter outer membrane subunit [Candidatus Glassbacteria bacterium]
MKFFAMQTNVLLALLVIQGCAVHRTQNIEPPVEPPAAFNSVSGAAANHYGGGRWWLVFDDSALSEVIDSALAANYGLAQAVARLEQADAARRSARAGRLPSLNLEGRTSRGQQANVFGNYISKTAILSASAAYELDVWRKMAAAHAAGRLDAEAGRSDLESMYLTVSASAADLYYLVAEQREQLALTRRTIESFEQLTDLVDRRYELGLVEALDVYQARQNLAGARARAPQIEAELAAAEHALSLLLGRYPGTLEDAVVAELPAVPEAFPAGLPSELLARRPDVEAALLRVMAADARVGQAVAQRFPSFNLTGDYGRSRSDYGFDVISANFWNLAGSVLMPLFDGGRRRAEADRARAAFRERLAFYHETVLGAFGEVEDALVRNRTTEERIGRLEERVESTGGALRLAVDNYSQGLSDYLPVLTGQSADFDARSQLVAARRQLISHRISLARALGGNWMESEAENRLSAK